MKKQRFFLVFILLVDVFFLGFCLGSMEQATHAAQAAVARKSTGQALRLHPTPDGNAGFLTIPLNQGNYRSITCLGFDDVAIDIDGTAMNLKAAITEGLLSVDQIIAFARQDANLGFCTETASCQNGLSQFTYCYDDFSLRSIYDLYQAADGSQHLICDVLIYAAGCEPHFLPVDAETGERIDYPNAQWYDVEYP